MRRNLILLLALTSGFSAAVLAGIAGATSFTIALAKNAPVTNQSGKTTHEAIAVTSRGGAVYTLSGDSAAHPKCTAANQCFSFWPPVKVKSAKSLSKAPGIKGKLGTWRRNGFIQLTLSGHPLYNFSGDSHKNSAKGEGIKGFGGTWHVVSEGASSGSTSGSGGMTTTTGTGTTTTGTGTGTTTTTCTDPPYCY
jgi:predicted lipoprotein with Yx(FWY)xxD motif